MKKNKIPSIENLINDETFDLNPEEIRKLGYRFSDMITDYYNSISTSPILPSKTLKQLKQLFDESLPQDETDIDSLLLECQEKIIDNAVRFGHPRFLGWILSSGTIIGAYADGLANALNQNVALSGSGVATVVEVVVFNWIKKILGYNSNAAGVLVSGGSIANLIALAVARNTLGGKYVRQHGLANKIPLTIYTSSEAHVCIDKAVDLLGIGTDNIRRIAVDANFRLDSNELKRKIKEDLSKGLHPFCVVATAGTVNTGAIDPLDAIKDICRQYNMWFHVDAAYGGFVAISSEHKSLIKGIAQADSVVVDPHKWLFIPYDVGCVLVKDPKKMKKTFSYPTDYIALDKKKKLSNDEIDFADYSIELSRSFRALKIWMSLKQYGIRRYEKIINQNMKLIEYWQELIKNSQDFQIMAPSVLSVVCFRFNPEKAMKIKNENKELYLDKLNRLIIKSIRENREFLISGTMLNGRYVLRACIVNYRTTKQDVKYIIQALREIGKKNHALLKSQDI